MAEGTKLTVTELEQGWAMISFATQPANDQDRYRFLQRTLHDWLKANEHYVVQDVQSIRFRDKLYGLNVFYALDDQVAKPPVHFDVDSSVARKFGNEYIEAVMADAVQFIATTQVPHNTMALTNRREVTIVVDRIQRRGWVMLLEHFRPRLNAQQAKDLDEWLAGGNFGYLVVPLPDGFQP